ncbi:uncharacterized protein LOC111001906 isoform X2 [Pieris rapae]|uniref:uncharacterized protein LOC111001906 isoform X2 n=1 Tax=Pieris rapae TaxID=64459 RepID=UPI001E27E110|nr:uncharacterized protein LOC111001906 isoform X2 [Pieris rapae]
MSNYVEERSIVMAAEIINTFSQGSNLPTMNHTGTQFSPDAVPFQTGTLNNSGYMNKLEPQIADQASPSTTGGLIGFMNDFSKINLNEQPENQIKTDLDDKSPADSTAGLNVVSEDSDLFSFLNTDNLDLVEQCLSTANYYVSMLTRDQRNVLRSIRPNILYAFLVEVAKIRNERQRLQRQVIDECAFCKNNGENEEFYLSHVLKDSRGRVLCPVLRAFRCPRCGATGDRAHTIKYCHQRSTDGFDRNGYFPRRHGNSPPPSVTLGFRIAEARRMVGVNAEEPLYTPENSDNWFANNGIQ